MEQHISQLMSGGNDAFRTYVREIDENLLVDKFVKYSIPQVLFYRYYHHDGAFIEMRE